MTPDETLPDSTEPDGGQDGDRGPSRAFLHVGAPKAGVAFLQQALWGHRRALAAAGLLCPGEGQGSHHEAALELRGAAFGGHRDPRRIAAWDRLVGEAADWSGDVLITSELLAWATPEEAARAVASLSDRYEVHLVVVVGDLTRQVPAVWLEEMRNRRDTSYQAFLRELVDPATPEPGPAGIWGGQDLRLVTRSWAADLPAERVHVVTLPAGDDADDELWRRFCDVVGIDPALRDSGREAARDDPGYAGGELLRRVNARLPESVEWPAYQEHVKDGIAQDPLSGRADDTAPPLPVEVAAVLAERTRAVLDHVRERGYAVTGDLAELEAGPVDGGEDAGGSIDDVAVDESRVADAGVDSVVRLISRLAQAPGAATGPTADRAAPAEPVAPFAGRVDLSPRHNPAHARRKTIFLLVGSPKTGLDRVREVLWANRSALAQQDIHLPLSPHDHFLATLDLRGVGHEHPDAERGWTRISDDLAQTRSGTWIIGHELFAPVSAERAMAAIRRLTPAEVHVVVVARGLERQIPAEWVETLRHGSVTPFGRYADHVVQSLDGRPHVPWFWQVQDPVDIAERWGGSLSPDKVHVITSPAGVSDADEQLWLRVCATIGIDRARIDTSALGAPYEPRPVDAEVLRRLNLALQDEEWAMAGEPPAPTEAYGRTVRDLVARQVLARVPEPHSVSLPGSFDVWLARQADVVVRELRGKKYDVVGDVAELRPVATGEQDDRLPEDLPEHLLVPAAMETVAGTSARVGGLVQELERLRERLAETENERDKLNAQVERLTGPMRAGRRVFDAMRGQR